MATRLSPDVLSDTIAVSLAGAIAAANKHAGKLGIDVSQSLLTISQHLQNEELLWRVNYGPKNYIGQRGGDLIIDLDPSDASIRQVLWGQ